MNQRTTVSTRPWHHPRTGQHIGTVVKLSCGHEKVLMGVGRPIAHEQECIQGPCYGEGWR